MSDPTSHALPSVKAAAGRLREAAGRLRDVPEDITLETVLAVAEMLEVEAHIRETQPRGFYEVAEADLIAEAVLAD